MCVLYRTYLNVPSDPTTTYIRQYIIAECLADNDKTDKSKKVIVSQK
jgi:hypothetical protein